jgi:hypothetical protein
MRWTGEHFVPADLYWARQANNRFTIGALYPLEAREDRSSASHRHYFAALHQAWDNLPLETIERWPTPEHLRRWALIKCGYANERSIVCASPEEARSVAAFIAPFDDFAIVMAREAVVSVFTAKSQSVGAMDKKTFEESKSKVLEYIASLIGASARTLTAHERASVMFRLPKRRERLRSGIHRAPIREFQRHRAYIRRLRCVCDDDVVRSLDLLCCEGRIECCHVRLETNGGAALKPSDWWTFPGCRAHHDEAHQLGESRFQDLYGLDLKEIALRLARRSPDLHMRQVMKEAGLW